MKKIDIKDLKKNPYTMFAEEWPLLTAGKTKDNYNTMTVSWGHIGCLWGHKGGKATVVAYVRPSRYTKKFMDENDYFTLSFFDEKYRKDLAYLGSHSGRDEDKVAKTAITPCEDNRAVYFNEANTVIVCRKLYAQEIKDECFIDRKIIDDSYPLRDFHTVYVGEIEEVLVNN